MDFSAVRSINDNEINCRIIKNQQIENVVLFRSANGTDFTEIGKMNIKGTFSESDDYYYKDCNTAPTTFFYKAKIKSASSIEFTKIVKIQSSENIVITVTPNPASNWVNINFTNNNRQKTTFNLLNAGAKSFMQLSTNNNYLQIDSGNLPNGVYTIQIIQNNEIVQTKRFIVQH